VSSAQGVMRKPHIVYLGRQVTTYAPLGEAITVKFGPTFLILTGQEKNNITKRVLFAII